MFDWIKSGLGVNRLQNKVLSLNTVATVEDALAYPDANINNIKSSNTVTLNLASSSIGAGAISANINFVLLGCSKYGLVCAVYFF